MGFSLSYCISIGGTKYKPHPETPPSKIFQMKPNLKKYQNTQPKPRQTDQTQNPIHHQSRTVIDLGNKRPNHPTTKQQSD